MPALASPLTRAPSFTALGASLTLLVAVLATPVLGAEKYALVVGVDRYRETELSSLDYADDDAIDLGLALERLGFDVIAMTSRAEQVNLQPDDPAAILESLDRRLRFRDPDDIVVVSLSGHGVQLVGDEALADGSRETWFCPAKAKLSDRATLLPISEIVRRLSACPAARKLLLVDACRNDMTPPGAGKARDVIVEELDPAAPARRQVPKGLVSLFSCSPKERSFERKELSHSLFSFHVIEYLAGRADDPKRWYDAGEARLGDLVTYAQKKTARAAEAMGADQTPELVGRMTDWSFGQVGADLASVERKPAMERSLPAVPAVPPAKKPPGGLKPGEVIENSLGMKLVLIPAGEFQMGSAATKEQLKARGMAFFDYRQFDTSDERPIHRVQITTPFLMGQTEVTLGQFMSFYNDGYMGKLDCETDGKGGWGYTGGKPEFAQEPRFSPWSWGHPDIDIRTEAGKNRAFRYPVMNVSWTDSMAFCEWLAKKEGKKYRLPTEAEWEYACRAGTTSQFWNGDDSEGLAAIENVADGAAKQKFPWWKGAVVNTDGHAFTSPVGAFPRPNPFGLYDMHGNVSEWCSDWYDENYYASFASTPAVDPQGPVSASSFRVVRGGSWHYDAASCRSAYRGNVPPSRRGGIGFRVVCELE